MLRSQCATNKKRRSKKRRVETQLTSKGIVGHTEEGQIVWGSKDMEDVAILREGEVMGAVGGQRGGGGRGGGGKQNLLEQAAGNGPSVAGDGAELGEDDGASGDEGVEDRHGSCRRSSEQISANPETETETETEKTKKKKKKKKEECLRGIN
jgi:hypothetical protein